MSSGCAAAQTLNQAIRAQIEHWWSTDYAELNACHAAEVLGERAGITVSRSTMQRIRLGDGSHNRWFGPAFPPWVFSDSKNANAVVNTKDYAPTST